VSNILPMTIEALVALLLLLTILYCDGIWRIP
jgi:hypothetical protein